MRSSPRHLLILKTWRSSVWLICALFAFGATAGCSTPGLKLGPAATETLPLGREDLVETHETVRVAQGLTHKSIRRGPGAQVADSWALRSGPLRSDLELAEAENCLTARARALVRPERYAYPGRPELTYQVFNAGKFASAEAALSDPSYTDFKACGFKLQDMAMTPQSDTGPWEINVLEIDPQLFAGRTAIALANEVIAGVETVEAIARRAGAIAALNASFFVMHNTDGIVGDVAGLAVLGGQIVSEPLNGRSALVLSNHPRVSAKITDIDEAVSVLFPDGRRVIADGINRAPGLSRNCGNMDDFPTSMPVHDATCSDSGEIIVFDSMAGFVPDPSASFSAFIDDHGLVSGTIPDDWATRKGFALVATGDRATELAPLMNEGTSAQILNAFGEGRDDMFAINGAPLLIKDGEFIDRAHTEGWPLGDETPAARADEVHQWINLRAPRTAVGVRPDGHILFVTIDGRRPNVSVGATIAELRSVMRSLGAADALNLDGGGSSTLVVNGRLANVPSDPSGPRPVADAILFLDDAN